MTKEITALEFDFPQFGSQSQEFAKRLAEASANTERGDPVANLVIGPDGVEAGSLRLEGGSHADARCVNVAVCVEGFDPDKSELAAFIKAQTKFGLGLSGQAPELSEPQEGLQDLLHRWCSDVRAGRPSPSERPASSASFAQNKSSRSARTSHSSELPPEFTGSPQQLEDLQPHVINMSHGKLSDSGMMRMTESDLDRVVEAIIENCVAGDRSLMMHAHGGLNSEKAGLATAWDYHRWWLDNGVYPLYFVWETGALDALWHVLAGERRAQAQARGISDWTDRWIEGLSRRIGRLLWDEMKRNARRCSQRGGGAYLFAQKLLRRLNRESSGTSKLATIAVGHSAGAIFQARFLPRLGSEDAIDLRQIHLLAPAINETDFADNLVPVLEEKKPDTVMYTMTKRAERMDDVAGLYKKSLLYLVRNAFEHADDPLIAGLQESWEDSAVFRKHLSQVIWSPTQTGVGSPRNRSRSEKHGCFDNDQPTMESVMRRVLDLADDRPLPAGFPTVRARAAVPDPVRPPNFYAIPKHLRSDLAGTPTPGIAAQPTPPPTESAAAAAATCSTGRQKVALCIGNNAFVGQPPLHGCINDAHEWKRVFEAVGFTARVAGDCTADQMRDEIRKVTSAARPGDVIALQISSHGTQVRDQDGDEMRDDLRADMYDEALIGIDADRGGVIVDDEWEQLLAVPDGVRLVRFHDFCSSGRSSRMASPAGRRVRFAPLTHAQEGAAIQRMASRGVKAGSRSASYDEQLSNLTFVACEPDKYAYESNGMGDFTRSATRLLAGAGQNMTAQQIIEAIQSDMVAANQKPDLEGPGHLRTGGLFEPLA